MRTQVVLTSAFLVVATMGPALAQDQSPEAAETDATVASTAADQPLSAMPSYQEPVVAWDTVDDALPDEAICRDRIHKAREQLGQPPLQRESTTGDEGVMIWAVDRRENGCAVLVAKGDPEDIRPIPRIEEDHRLRPVR